MNPRLYEMLKGNNNSSRSKYNQRNNRQAGGGGNDYRNNRPQQQAYQRPANGTRTDGSATGGYQRQSRFSSAVPAATGYQNRAAGATNGLESADKRPLAYQSQNQRYDTANGYAQKNAAYGQSAYGQSGMQKPTYQAYHAAASLNGHHNVPVTHVYSAPPPASVQYSYPPPVLPVKN